MAGNTLIVISGPTAVGKTDLCINLAQKLHTDIISADSRQIYREMKIGTARPDEQTLNKAKHYFIGTKSIHDYYTAGMFELEVLDMLRQHFKEKETMIMTGGSGLYINAVCNGIDALPKADPEVRSKLVKQYEEGGIEGIRDQLKLLDPESYHNMDLKNPKRILKALEVTLTTGKPYSSFLTRQKKSRSFHILKIGLRRDRNELYERINKRVDQMIEQGLIEEARDLYPYKHLNPLNTVGYKELFDYFDGIISLEEAIRRIKRNTRRYAKRQLTWFARDKEMEWFHPEEKNKILKYIRSRLSKLRTH
ncbi:MAG: tRNA (adenosine(37)-N6)-dimethylallyltransferase MiaA [Bacteroidales bacterium]|nr:tRNA (adenosine(37)-N6)-dimethylallyltransferase MiaA [Bacteroidales bacterium]